MAEQRIDTDAVAISVLGKPAFDNIMATATEAECLTGLNQAKVDYNMAVNDSERDTANANSYGYGKRRKEISKQAVLATRLAAYHAKYTLDEYRLMKEKQFDQRTGQLIKSGVVFEGKLFSTSIEAQMNWKWLEDHKHEQQIIRPQGVK